MREVRLSSIDLNLLLVFDAIMIHASVSAAADQLHRTQSAVSHALARLRTIIGDPLFVRTPGGMVPTAYASAIAPRIRSALFEIQDALVPQEAFDPARYRGTIAAGMTDYMAYLLLPDLAARLAQAAPGLTLDVVPCFARACAAPLDDDRIALFVGNAPPDLPPWLVSAPLYQERQVCVARCGHPAMAGNLSVDIFLAQRHVDVSPWGDAGYVEAALAGLGVERQLAVTVGSFLAVAPVLERTDLLAVLPERLARRMAQSHALAVALVPFDLGISPIGLTWHRRLDRDLRITWLREEIAAILLADHDPLARSTDPSLTR
ncbi:LysR family transcriptional regulator [Novosphingobium lentum]|uniref:LysR family transcriptional regulator n=1 Tax=Novosphingobium lentum TaxID=145287 RepID=UPI00082EE524|nr:LysR family transcriptional regulator [Novosphingobium lentum]